MSDSRLYTQSCFTPRNGVDGPGLAEFVLRVARAGTLNWAAATDVDLAGEARSELCVDVNRIVVLTVHDLLAMLNRAGQVSSATLFLCEDKEAAMTIQATEAYAASVSKSDVTVRAVDDTYVYVIAPAERATVLMGTLPPVEQGIQR
ncbi:MAG: hypothetical protein ACKVPX_03035 [Myxococcaceae bacterium]